jgi:tetratricopeptide (TPR) repeat protein
MAELENNLATLLRADGEGPAERIDAAAAARLIEGVLDQAQAAPVKTLRIPKYGWLLVAALVLTGSAMGMYAALGERSEPQLAAPARRATPRPAAPATVTEPSEPAAVAAGQVQDPEPQPSASADAGVFSAPDLLARANRLRGDGKFRAAERAYLRVVAQSPASPSAYAARVAAAALRREHLSDPKGALALYGQALRSDPKGALGPEIHAGMAEVYGQLGQTAQERRALQALLRRSPQGPAAERARKRLQELE